MSFFLVFILPFVFCNSSFDHITFVNGDGLHFGTADSIISVIASVSELSLL